MNDYTRERCTRILEIVLYLVEHTQKMESMIDARQSMFKVEIMLGQIQSILSTYEDHYEVFTVGPSDLHEHLDPFWQEIVSEDDIGAYGDMMSLVDSFYEYSHDEWSDTVHANLPQFCYALLDAKIHTEGYITLLGKTYYPTLQTMLEVLGHEWRHHDEFRNCRNLITEDKSIAPLEPKELGIQDASASTRDLMIKSHKLFRYGDRLFWRFDHNCFSEYIYRALTYDEYKTLR